MAANENSSFKRWWPTRTRHHLISGGCFPRGMWIVGVHSAKLMWTVCCTYESFALFIDEADWKNACRLLRRNDDGPTIDKLSGVLSFESSEKSNAPDVSLNRLRCSRHHRSTKRNRFTAAGPNQQADRMASMWSSEELQNMATSRHSETNSQGVFTMAARNVAVKGFNAENRPRDPALPTSWKEWFGSTRVTWSTRMESELWDGGGGVTWSFITNQPHVSRTREENTSFPPQS
jgi:hypothetical protein